MEKHIIVRPYLEELMRELASTSIGFHHILIVDINSELLNKIRALKFKSPKS